MLKSVELEGAFKGADRKRLTLLVARAARRLLPVIARTADDYGPEGLEWFRAAHGALQFVERFASGQAITRFTLDLTADVARSTANVAANCTRILGLHPSARDAELALAAVAFAADTARASSAARAETAARQGLQVVATSGVVPVDLLQFDLAALPTGEYPQLWPGGEPEWSRKSWERLRRAELTGGMFGSSLD